MAALAPEIARSAPAVKKRLAASINAYRDRLTGLMPGTRPKDKKRNFELIFSAMIGAVAMARTFTDPQEKQHLLNQVRDHLLAAF